MTDRLSGVLGAASAGHRPEKEKVLLEKAAGKSGRFFQNKPIIRRKTKMKKIFALALAAIMTAGMATVAFAAPAEQVVVGYGADGSAYTTFYVINSDNEVKVKNGSAVTATSELKGGDRVAIPLIVWAPSTDNDTTVEDAEASWYTVNSDYDKKIVVRADWKVGEAETSIEKIKFPDTTTLSTSDSKYVYCLVVTMPENQTNKKADVAGTVQVGRSASAAKDSIGEVKVEFSYYADATDNADVSKDLVKDKTGIVDFSNEDGEIDINFEDVATFTVDVDGQGKLNLAWNTDFDKEFGAKYDYANLEFITFEGTPSFNKNGTLYIYAENKNTFVYEATEDGAKAVDAKWNEDYEAWELKTRKLTKYVLSDVELDKQTVTEDTSSSTTDGGKDNPDTGR